MPSAKSTPTDLEIKSNRLSVFLIKDKYKDFDSISNIKDDSWIKKQEIKDVGVVYYKESEKYAPLWLPGFFGEYSAELEKHIFNSNSRAVLIIKININTDDIFFAIPFGTGRFLLKDYSWVEGFGLKTALNTIAANSIRRIDKIHLSDNPKISREQISKAVDAYDFGIDFYRDILQAITGKSESQDFCNIISGKDSLQITEKIDLTNIKEFLQKCYTHYKSDKYKVNFDWIDYIQEIRDDDLIKKLIEVAKEEYKNENWDKIWVACPEIIDWDEVKEFKMINKRDKESYENISIEDIFKIIDVNDFNFEYLTKNYIFTIDKSTETSSKKWSIYQTLNAEVDYKSDIYILTNSKWYKIESTFVGQVNKEIGELKAFAGISFPKYSHTDENQYNQEVATTNSALCFDHKEIYIGGGKNKIELCDILTKDGHFIHVKKYGGSSVLSHLFSQGYVSAELFISEATFRIKTKDRIKKITSDKDFLNLIPKKKPNPSNYGIVYLVLSTTKRKATIPFFSKVNLRIFASRLMNYGYSVYLNFE